MPAVRGDRPKKVRGTAHDFSDWPLPFPADRPRLGYVYGSGYLAEEELQRGGNDRVGDEEPALDQTGAYAVFGGSCFTLSDAVIYPPWRGAAPRIPSLLGFAGFS
jgi:hypothetical protein